MSIVSRLSGTAPLQLAGRCRRCNGVHVVDNDVAVGTAALDDLFHALDHDAAFAPFRAALSASRGKMLAVLVADDVDGQRHVLKAFSGDLGGPADWPGWAPSIIRREHTAALEAQTLQTLATLTKQLDDARTTHDVAAADTFRRARKQTSATLMAAMHDAVRLTSMAQTTSPLREVFYGNGIPSGTADCGLPKLLHAINARALRFVGCAEAWWGRDLGDRRHGALQAPCAGKCQPILGHLLCRR